MVKYNVLGVSCGQGIGLYPFLRNSRRYNVLANVEARGEYHTKNEEQWKLNFGDIPYCRSLEELNITKKVHIIVSQPKCGGSSILRLSRAKQFSEKKDEKTLNMFIQGVQKWKPEAFLLENLPKLLELHSEEEFAEIFEDYNLVFHKCSVSDFGNSQKSRVRLVIVGVKVNSSSFDFTDFIKVFQVNKPKFTRELISDIPKSVTGHVIEDPSKKMAMYDYRDYARETLPVSLIKTLWTGDFKNEWKWPIKTKKMWTLPGVYRNKDNDFPLTARKSDRQFKENGDPMSPRELARIMGIPDSFQIYIDMSNKQYWINKGRLIVTQTFPYEIGRWFKKCLQKSNKL